MKKKVVLVGFPGSGKTTVGRVLKEVYGWKWIDLDEEIERKAGTSVTRIIREEGEQRFRELEREALVAALASDLEALSLGGGALLNAENRKDLLAHGLVIQLAVTEEEAVARLLHDEEAAERQKGEPRRPLLASGADRGLAGKEGIRRRAVKLMNERAPLYAAAAQAIVDTDQRAPQAIAEEIIEIAAGKKI